MFNQLQVSKFFTSQRRRMTLNLYDEAMGQLTETKLIQFHVRGSVCIQVHLTGQSS